MCAAIVQEVLDLLRIARRKSFASMHLADRTLLAFHSDHELHSAKGSKAQLGLQRRALNPQSGDTLSGACAHSAKVSR